MASCTDVSDYFLCWIAVFWSVLDPLTKIWGGLTSVVLLTVGVDLLFVHQLAGGFAVAAALITFFLETSWAVSLCLQVSLRNENHPLQRCWAGVLWFETWKRTVIYAILAILIFIQPHREWFSTLAGVTLIALGLLHIARWYNRAVHHVQPTLLDHQEDAYHQDEVELDLSQSTGPIVSMRRQVDEHDPA